MSDTDTPIEFVTLDASITATQESADLIARKIGESDHHTDTGKDDAYTRNTAEHREHLAKLTAKVEEITTTAEQHHADVYATVMPTPQNDTAAVAAELQAARILARPDMNDPASIGEYITTAPASPARTAVIQELVARGVISDETANAHLLGAHPDYLAATRGLNAAQTVTSTVYRPRLQALARRLEDRTAPGADSTERHPASIVPHLPALNVGDIPAWAGNNAEQVYRNQ